MNLHLRPGAPVRLVATAVARPLDLDPPGQRGVLLDNEAVHAHVLGPDWREQLARKAEQSPATSSSSRGAEPATRAHAEPAVHTRQWVRDATALDLATRAAQRVLAAAGIQPTDLAALVCVTSTPPAISSAMAARVGRALGCSTDLCNASSFDVRAGGVGVMMAWFSAQGLIVQGSGPVLIVAAEAASSFLRPDDLGSALLYADGAGACILASADHTGAPDTFLGGMSGQVALQGRPTTIPGVLPPTVHPHDGHHAQDYRFQRPDRAHLQDLLHLWGRFPRVLASTFPEACQQVRHFLPYAVSTQQMAVAHEALGQPDAQIFHELGHQGCVGAASPLVALHGLRQSGRVQPGDVVAIASAAGNGLWAGFFWRL